MRGAPPRLSLTPGRRNLSPSNTTNRLGITFSQNFTSMEYNVTAVEQNDPTLDNGPAYLLSGLSNSGYWYQAGLSWNWSPGQIPGIGFNMNYEVFAPSGRLDLPASSGAGLLSFSGPINQGDRVLVRLYFANSNVIMAADDENTGASQPRRRTRPRRNVLRGPHRHHREPTRLLHRPDDRVVPRRAVLRAGAEGGLLELPGRALLCPDVDR